MLWDNWVAKRIVQALNQYGISVSHPYLVRSSKSLSKDIVRLAQGACVDPTKLKILVYDNYNWQKVAYEASSIHGTVPYNQVSGLLICIEAGSAATRLTDVRRFDELEGRRTQINAHSTLKDILPTANDHQLLARHASVHVATILSEEVACLREFRVPDFFEPHPIPPHHTERYFLPTLDQEQASTKGSIAVLEEYFINVL
ncbi:hypothetical protein PM082_017715 [Marasmius tenuissimus]|nr:hypothetical protein PM082_017715 [Marasmius tenuissimus]